MENIKIQKFNESTISTIQYFLTCIPEFKNKEIIKFGNHIDTYSEGFDGISSLYSKKLISLEKIKSDTEYKIICGNKQKIEKNTYKAIA